MQYAADEAISLIVGFHRQHIRIASQQALAMAVSGGMCDQYSYA